MRSTPRTNDARWLVCARASSDSVGPVSRNAAQLLVEDRLHGGQVLPGLGRRLQDEQAAELATEREGRHVGGDLVLVDEPPVQARAAAGGQDVAGQRQVVETRVAERGDIPRLVDPRLRHAILQHDAALPGAPGEVDVRLDERRSRGDVPEVALDPRPDVLGVDVAGDHQHGVGGAVPRLEPGPDVVERRGVQVVHRPDRRMVVGVAVRIRVLEDHQEHLAVGLVLALPLLVLHHPALLVEPRLVDRAEHVPHAVRLHPQRHVEGGGRHHLEVVGAVLVGGAVHAGGPDAVERLEVVVVEVLAAVEHQVLEQVREAGLARRLVRRPDVVPDVDGDDRRLVVLVDDQPQAVVEDVLRVGDVDRLLCCGGLAGGEEAEEQRGCDESLHGISW